MKKYISLLTILSGTIIAALPISALAMFCPTNFSQITDGMSPDEVKSICGAPTSIETKEENENVPQEWSYFITQQNVVTSTTQQTTGTVKMTVMFDSTGKSINIT